MVSRDYVDGIRDKQCKNCIYFKVPVFLEPCVSCDELLKNKWKEYKNEEEMEKSKNKA